MTTIDPLTIRSSNPFEAFRLTLIKRLLALQPPKPISVNPHPTDFEALAAHVRSVTGLLDDWLSDVGTEARLAAPELDLRDFTDAFSDAIDGNAAYLLEDVANEMRDQQRSAA